MPRPNGRPRKTGPQLCKGPCGEVHPEAALRQPSGAWVGRCMPCRWVQKQAWRAAWSEERRQESAKRDRDNNRRYWLGKLREHWTSYGHQLLRFRRGPGCRTCAAQAKVAA